MKAIFSPPNDISQPLRPPDAKEPWSSAQALGDLFAAPHLPQGLAPSDFNLMDTQNAF